MMGKSRKVMMRMCMLVRLQGNEEASTIVDDVKDGADVGQGRAVGKW